MEKAFERRKGNRNSIQGGPVNGKKDVVVVSQDPEVQTEQAEQSERTEAIHRGLLIEGSRIAALTGGNLFVLYTEESAYNCASWVQTAKSYLEEIPFRLILFAHTEKGRELAPLIAQGFNAPAVLDCFDIRFRNDNLYYARYVYGGQFEQEVSFANPPEIATLNPESCETRDAVSSASVPFKEIHMRVPERADKKKTIKTIPPDFRTVDIRDARRILDIGAGCDRPELMKLAEELSVLLEASIGATRLVTDNGHIPKTRMIGQTGKEVSPELCLALGVSGSPHHISGVLKSGTIFSVNSDARAPIFGMSDTGFIADLDGLLPKLIRRIIQFRDKGLT